jgi:hypothetical protein
LSRADRTITAASAIPQRDNAVASILISLPRHARSFSLANEISLAREKSRSLRNAAYTRLP